MPENSVPVPGPAPEASPEPEVRRFETVGSTNDEACAWARLGAPHLSLVLSREQSGGRGRRGHSWSSPLGAGFYGSLIVRPQPDDANQDAALLLSRWTIAAAVGVARALDGLGLRAGLKWPNDVLLNGRKVAGVLCEAEWHASRPTFLIVGVGLNVAHTPEMLPERPVFPATSLLIESGQAFEPERVESALVAALRLIAIELEQGGWGSIREEWEQRCVGLGELASVSDAGRKFFGVLRGLDQSGALLIAAADGPRRVVSGEVAFE